MVTIDYCLAEGFEVRLAEEQQHFTSDNACIACAHCHIGLFCKLSDILADNQQPNTFTFPVHNHCAKELKEKYGDKIKSNT